VAADPLVAPDGGRALGLWAIERAAGSALHAAAIAAVSGAVLLWTARRFAGLTPGAVLTVVSLDLAMFALPLVTSVVPAEQVYAQDASLLEPVAGDPAARVSATHLSAFAGGDNVTIVFRVRSLIGYDSFTLEAWDRLWQVAQDADPEVLAASGVTHVVTDRPGGRRLVSVSEPRGHLWWTDRPVTDMTEDMLGTTTFYDEATIAIEQDVPGRLRATVEAPRAGWFVFTEIIYPGWRARVNDAPVSIAPAFGVFQAVPAPAGRSTIEFAFRPAIVWWGLGLTLVGLVAAGAAAIRRPASRLRGSPPPGGRPWTTPRGRRNCA
jgi:hypothetical protein